MRSGGAAPVDVRATWAGCGSASTAKHSGTAPRARRSTRCAPHLRTVLALVIASLVTHAAPRFLQ
eukprot:6141372-Pyramimonas_sp.AAC.1